MPRSEVAIAEGQALELVTTTLAKEWGMFADGKSDLLIQTMLETVFDKKNPPNYSQILAFCSVCQDHSLNPFKKQIYALLKQGGGVQPYVPIDGWIKLAHDHDKYDGFKMDTEFKDGDPPGIPHSCTVTIYRKDQAHPVVWTEYFRECKKDTVPWKTKPVRQLQHKTFIQGARYAFGFSGIQDKEEAQDAVHETEAQVVESKAVAPESMDALTAALPSSEPSDQPTVTEVFDIKPTEVVEVVIPPQGPGEHTTVRRLEPGESVTVEAPKGEDQASQRDVAGENIEARGLEPGQYHGEVEPTKEWEHGLDRDPATLTMAYPVACGPFDLWADEEIAQGPIRKRHKTWREAADGSQGGFRAKMLLKDVNEAQPVWKRGELPPPHHQRALCCLGLIVATKTTEPEGAAPTAATPKELFG